MKAATKPSKPPAPINDPPLSDSSKTYLGFVPLSYAKFKSHLYMDTVSTESNPRSIHSGFDLLYEVDATTHLLVLGITYRFYLVAVNEFGASENSEKLVLH